MTKKDRNMLLGVLMIALLGASWMLVIQPQRKAASAARAQVATAQQQLSTAQQDVETGKQAEAAFRRDRVAIVKLGRVVPETDDIPTLLVQLDVLARRHKIEFNTYELVQAQGSPAGAAPPAAGAAGAAGAEGTETTVGADGKPSTSADATAPLYPPGSSEIPGGLGRTSMTLKLQGTYFDLERFLRSVQHFAVVSAERTTAKGRLMMVDSFTYGLVDSAATDQKPSSKKPKKLLNAELTASIYFAPPVEAPSGGGGGEAGGVPTTPPAGGTTTTGTATIGGAK